MVPRRARGIVGFRMNYRHIAFAAAAICTASMTPPSANAGEARAVVELFTSQGCSSCPPADKLMGELSRDPSLVIMSLPVDYWDYLGWKDTLAQHGHSNRERAYSEVRGDREVYTPQVVVNGLVHVLGSDKAAIEQAIAQTRRRAVPLGLPVTLTVADGKVSVNVPAAKDASQSGEVWLCPITGKAQVEIRRGENRGHTLEYYNVVRRWVKLGDWSGKVETFSLPVADLPNADFSLQDIDRVTVLVQSGSAAKPGLMLGAATASLR
jgi:hypothetical protein